MDSLTKALFTTILPSGEKLPFRLAIQRINYRPYNTSNFELQYMDYLVNNESYLKDAIYSVHEYDNFSILIESEQECEVTIKLSTIKTDLNGLDFLTYTFNTENKVHEIFNFNSNKKEKSQNVFPWSADSYHFEVTFQEHTYYGILKVKPRHMSEDDLEWMRTIINDKLYGLVIDFMKYKRSWSSLDSIRETPFWHLWEWYKNNESQLLTQIYLIEQQSIMAIDKMYKVQEAPRKLDQNSIRWATTAKGVMHYQTKFLNRRIHYINDSEENRNAKQFLHRIYLKLIEIRAMIQSVKTEVEHKYVVSLNEAHTSDNKLQSFKNQYTVSPIEVNKFKNIRTFKVKEAEKLLQQIQNYNVMCEEIEQNLKRLSSAMNKEFWQKISMNRSQRILIGNETTYKIIYKIYKEMSVMINHDSEKSVQLPVYKRTEELYEYFVFFSVIDLFIKQGFEADLNALFEQLKASFYQEGIRDGTEIALTYNDLTIHLVFDEEIPFTEEQAKERFSRLMTEQERRKPDLRLDAYRIVDNELVYDSSIIIEVKCRPLKNIYNANARTNEMIQMSNYKSILRINSDLEYKKSGEKYNNHAIQFVLCLYAGISNSNKNYEEASCGKFIRFAPRAEEDTINIDLLEQEIFQRWLKSWE